MSMLKSLIYYIKESKYNPVEILHGAVYGLFVRTYLRILDFLMKRGSKEFRNHVADTYHGKVVRLDDATRFVTINRDINLASAMEQVLPYRNAIDIILKNPRNIVAFECPCRGLRKNPCRPTDVCLIIGDPFVDMVRLTQPLRTRRITVEEALTILKEEDERGHVHTAYFKTVMLNRFYAICNCCKCCCTGMRSMFELNVPRIQPSGYVAQIGDACIGCGKCGSFCQFDAIVEDERMTNNDAAAPKKKRRFMVIGEKCFGCGVCESKCKQKAIELVRDPAKGIPLNIEALDAGGAIGSSLGGN